MNAKLKATTYDGIAALLGNSSRSRINIGHNTYAQQNAADIGVILHSTMIARLSEHEITVNSGGWRTVTTKGRLDQLLRDYGWSLYQDRGVWMLHSWQSAAGGPVDFPFEDGMTLKRY